MIIEDEYKQVVAYVRKSSEDNDKGVASKQLNSFKYQREFINGFIRDNKMTLVHPIFQDDKTGYKAYVREEFNKMMDFIEENPSKVDGIVCFEPSRLARNFGDGGIFLWFMQKGLIKRIYTATKIFTNSSSDQMMLAIEIAMSKKSSDEGSERTRSGMKSKALTLKHPSRRPVLGYMGEGPKGARKWIIDPEKADKVRQVFEAYSTGEFNLQEICDYAFSIGLRSTDPRSKKGKISKNTWQGRLKDIQYTGIFYHGEEKVAGEYTPIISSELYYQVQEVMAGRFHSKSTHMDYAYSQMIHCEYCGGNLTGTHSKGLTYYRCRKDKAPCKENPPAYVPEKDIESQLFQVFESIELDQDAWKEARDYVNEINKPEKIKIKQYIKRLEAQLAQEEQSGIQIGLSFTRGDINKNNYKKLMADNEAKVVSIKNSIVKSDNIINELNEVMYKFLEDVRYITKRIKSASAPNKKALVEIFCENLEWKDGKLRIHWKKPYFILAKQPNKSIVLRGKDSNLQP